MQAETERRSLGARGDPELGSWLAYASILIVDDEGHRHQGSGIGLILAPDDMIANIVRCVG